MGVDEVEKFLLKDAWLNAEELSLKAKITSGNVRILCNKLVNKWKTAEFKDILIDNNWRRHWRLSK